MIPEALIKAEARRLGLDPMVIDLDHALGVVLWSLAEDGLGTRSWLFKGGTCLRKAYFDGYRFSEDLDFTVPGSTDERTAREVVERAAESATGKGIELLPADCAISSTQDEFGNRLLEIRLPYRGRLQWRGDPRIIQFHLDLDEAVAFDIEHRALIHPYPDQDSVSCNLSCYALEEILAEKLRAVCGQRRFAIARGIYDVWRLMAHGVDAAPVLQTLPRKSATKSVSLGGLSREIRGAA